MVEAMSASTEVPEITAALLLQLAPSGRDLPALAAAMQQHMPRFGVDTPRRVAAWLAQVGHESGGFTVFAERLGYTQKRLCQVWPARFREPVAGEDVSGPLLSFDGKRNPVYYANSPERLANYVYGGRLGNGPEESGDGYRFRGRGLIQLTGRANYQRLATAIGKPLDELPTWLEAAEGAVVSALWFWQSAKLSPLADAWDIEGITRRINGGLVGLEDRCARHAAAAEALGIA